MTDDAPRLFTAAHRERLLHRRLVVLDGVLDDDKGALIATQLLLLAAEDARTPVSLWIHSPGGSVPAMLAIRDVMPDRGRPVGIGTASIGATGIGGTR